MANLSLENRELRRELEHLRSITVDSYPEFDFLINDSSDQLFFTTRLDDFIPLVVSPLRKEDAPDGLVGYVEPSDIENYNRKLPSVEKVNRFNSLSKIHQCAEVGRFNFTVAIKNKGSVKANDVQVEIRLPDFLVFMAATDVPFAEKPELKLPDLPWDRIRVRAFGIQGVGGHKFVPPPVNIGSFDNMNLSGMRSLFHRVNSQIVNPQCLRIILKDLLQTKSEIIDRYYVFPSGAGDGVISVEIICEEIRTPCIYEIPVKASIE